MTALTGAWAFLLSSIYSVGQGQTVQMFCVCSRASEHCSFLRQSSFHPLNCLVLLSEDAQADPYR